MTGRALRAAIVVAALPFAACFVPMEHGRQMDARIQRLEVQSLEQQRSFEEQRQTARDRIEKVDKKLREVQAKIDELNQAARRSGADLGVNLARLQDDFAKMKGELEVLEHRLGEVERGLRSLQSDTESRLTALKGQGALDAYEARQRISTLAKPDDKAAFLALAKGDEERGEKGIAREIYEEYVRKWPSDPHSADAGFRAGAILFEQRRFREALLAYGKVAETFPRSDLAPDAMLGAAESMLQLEMKDDAVSVLGQIAQKYPRSDAAAKARARLKELSPPPPKRAGKRK